MVVVPCLWPASLIVILAGGPSLTAADVARCQGQHVIAIKDAFRLCPWAEVLYACDRKWWVAHPETATFTGLKYGLEDVKDRPDIQILKITGDDGLEVQPFGLRTHRNSGGQAINLAVHLGATRIVLLGYDMRPIANRHHWFGMHPYNRQPPPYDLFLRSLVTIVAPLQARGVEVINATPDSALTLFPQRSLEEALA